MNKTFRKAVIPVAEILKMSDADRKRFLVLTTIIRDLDVLQKLMHYCANDNEKGNDLETAAFMAGSFFLLKTLISKCYEVWDFIDSEKYINNKQYLSSPTLQRLSDLERNFQGKDKEIFRFIRNKFGFHYAGDDNIKAKINSAMVGQGDYYMWIGEESGNDVFESSTRIMLGIVFEEMQRLGFEGDFDNLFNILVGKSAHVSRIARNFCTSLAVNDVLKGIQPRTCDTIVFSPILIRDVSLPFIATIN